MTWEPITSDELDAMIEAAELDMEPPVLELWKTLRIRPAKWQLSPWGDLGGGFWVVAVIGDRCIWYNDIEDGFNISRYQAVGYILEYWCNQTELDRCIRGFLADLLQKLGCGPAQEPSRGHSGDQRIVGSAG
jgi:hypothetical protein